MWTVDRARNAKNDRWLAYQVEDVPPIMKTKHPASAMMLGVVASNGARMPPFWFAKGLKIDTEVYLDVLKNVVKPWIDATFHFFYHHQKNHHFVCFTFYVAFNLGSLHLIYVAWIMRINWVLILFS